MDWFWSWGGECFVHRDGESLFTYFGKEAERFDGEEIYGSNGRYLVLSVILFVDGPSKSKKRPSSPLWITALALNMFSGGPPLSSSSRCNNWHNDYGERRLE
jgi:hypothetical protein